jgi:hypothetical protein
VRSGSLGPLLVKASDSSIRRLVEVSGSLARRLVKASGPLTIAESIITPS